MKYLFSIHIYVPFTFIKIYHVWVKTILAQVPLDIAIDIKIIFTETSISQELNAKSFHWFPENLAWKTYTKADKIKMSNLGQRKKQSYFRKSVGWKFFYHSPALIVECASESRTKNFLFQKKISKTNKKN